jgi:hypothetical protein
MWRGPRRGALRRHSPKSRETSPRPSFCLRWIQNGQAKKAQPSRISGFPGCRPRGPGTSHVHVVCYILSGNKKATEVEGNNMGDTRESPTPLERNRNAHDGEGFEPPWAEPSGFLVHHNSATLSCLKYRCLHYPTIGAHDAWLVPTASPANCWLLTRQCVFLYRSSLHRLVVRTSRCGLTTQVRLLVRTLHGGGPRPSNPGSSPGVGVLPMAARHSRAPIMGQFRRVSHSGRCGGQTRSGAFDTAWLSARTPICRDSATFMLKLC